MYQDKSLVPAEAVRLAALGALMEQPLSYADLARDIRHFVARVVGPSLDLLGSSLEILRLEGLISSRDEAAAPEDSMLAITAAGEELFQDLMSSSLRTPMDDVSRLVYTLKMRFLDLLPDEAQLDQIDLLRELAENELARLEDLKRTQAELVQAGYRVLGALAPGLAVTQPDGTILIVRDAGGHFVLDGRINGARAEFLLDTGASAVVLTYEDALRAGYRPQDLTFSVPVSTANGRALVAPVKIDTITIGDHTLRNIRGFVGRQGTLDSSLFGMTALDHLRSWRIEGDKLIMTP